MSVEQLRSGLVDQLPQLRGFARSLTGGDRQLADDLVQDTVVLALRAWGSFTPGTSLKSWLLKILHNRFHSVIRRKHVTAEVACDDLHALASVPPPQHGRLEVAAFKRAFAELKPEHRAALVLSAVYGLPYEAIADICGCEVGTVKSRISRARAELKAMLLGEDDLGGKLARRETPPGRPRRPRGPARRGTDPRGRAALRGGAVPPKEGTPPTTTT